MIHVYSCIKKNVKEHNGGSRIERERGVKGVVEGWEEEKRKGCSRRPVISCAFKLE